MELPVMAGIRYGGDMISLDPYVDVHLRELNVVSPPPIDDIFSSILAILRSRPHLLNSTGTIGIAIDSNTATLDALSALLQAIPQWTQKSRVSVFFTAENGIPVSIHRGLDEYNTIFHNPKASHCIEIGETSNGTPIEVNEQFLECDVKIVIASLLPDAFWSVHGGLTEILPGLTSQKTNEHNSRLALNEFPRYFNITTPRFNDMREAADLVSIDMYLLIQTDLYNRITHLFMADSTDPLLNIYHQASKYHVQRVNHYYDLVFTGAGGTPLDNTLFDSFNAVYSAASVTRRRGTIVLISECSRGVGPMPFMNLLENLIGMDGARLSKLDLERARFIRTLLKDKHLLVFSKGITHELSVDIALEVFDDLSECTARAFEMVRGNPEALVIQDGRRIIPTLDL